jgi:glycosyltransferase involved in cell wall biosynthesis
MTMNKAIPRSELMRSIDSEASADRKVCIVTGELEGPHYNGGVGTTNRALAIVLRELGYDVDILYTQVAAGQASTLRGEFSDHVTAYANLGIRLMSIDNQSDRHDWQAKSFLSLQHLLKHRYRLVFFDELFGNAYYPLLARRTGNERLQNTIMCVTTHGAMEWISDINRQAIMNFESLPLIEMERRSVELADVVKAPSAYILKKYRNYGWAIGRNFIVMPNFVSEKLAAAHKPARRAIKEIVFFGRLERRKGLRMFCRALDRIKFELKGYTVTFLGKTMPEVTDKLVQKSATWPFPIRLLPNFDQAQALSYLKTGDRLAVMPSTEDNSPSVIIECLQENIPFLASAGSGGEELLHEDSRKDTLFEPSVDGLCNKLLEVIARGGRTARPSFSPKQIKRAFAAWVENTLASAGAPASPKKRAAPARQPILLVIVPAESGIDQALADLKNASAAFGGDIRIEVLTSKPKALAKGIASLGDALPVNVNDARDFPKIAKALSQEDPTVLGICHITQLLTPEWFERALACFQKVDSISAVTGMAGETTEVNALAERPYVSSLDQRHAIRRYLMGNAPPLFALVQSTNSGFLLMRSELLGLLEKTALFDEQYDRITAMEDLVHAMLVDLHRSGHNFELVPDILHVPLREIPLETQQAGNFLRSLAADLYGHARGTDQWLLSRLAIDSGLKHKRILAGREYLAYLSAKTGVKVSPVTYDTTWEQQSRELSMLAQASGQIELSVDLVSRLTFPERKPTTLNAVDRLTHAANTVTLNESLWESTCVKINLDHEWSLKTFDGDRIVQVHANRGNEGRAALMFTSVDLSRVTHFTCRLLTSQNGNPIRVRADLVSLDRTQSSSSDRVLTAKEDVTWEFEVPEKLRTECKVSLSVEMADPSDDINDGYVHFVEPRFISDPTERK